MVTERWRSVHKDVNHSLFAASENIISTNSEPPLNFKFSTFQLVIDDATWQQRELLASSLSQPPTQLHDHHFTPFKLIILQLIEWWLRYRYEMDDDIRCCFLRSDHKQEWSESGSHHHFSNLWAFYINNNHTQLLISFWCR